MVLTYYKRETTLSNLVQYFNKQLITTQLVFNQSITVRNMPSDNFILRQILLHKLGSSYKYTVNIFNISSASTVPRYTCVTLNKAGIILQTYQHKLNTV